jgi:hypothetical protein
MLTVSASEIDDFDKKCPRYWAFKHVEGIRLPAGDSAAFGTEVDDEQVQPYLRDGRPFDFTKQTMRGFLQSGYVAQTMLQWLPAPGSAGPNGPVRTQYQFLIPSPTWITRDDGIKRHVGFAYYGKLDMYAPDSAVAPGLPGGVPLVADTKTSSDIDKWGLNKETLATDTQGVLYPFAIMYETGARAVDLAWIYGQSKKTRKGKRVHLRVVADDVAREFMRLDAIACELHATRLGLLAPGPDGRALAAPGASALDDEEMLRRIKALTPNTDSCEMYGKPCDYASRCNLSPGEKIDALAARDRKRREQQARKGSVPAQAGKVDSSMNPTVLKLKELQARRAAAVGGAPAQQTAAEASTATAQTTPAVAASVAAPAAPPLPSTASAEKPLGVNPPESALPPAPPVGAAAPAPEPAKRRPKGSTNKAEGSDDPPHTVRVVWGEEKVFPVKYDSFTVGPFEATAFVRPGETATQAMERVYAELSAFAEKARLEKTGSFAAVLAAVHGGGK